LVLRYGCRERAEDEVDEVWRYQCVCETGRLGDRVRLRVSVGRCVYKTLVDLSVLLFKSLCLDIQNSKFVDTAAWLFSPRRSVFPKSHIMAFNVFATVSLKNDLRQPHGLRTVTRPVESSAVCSFKRTDHYYVCSLPTFSRSTKGKPMSDGVCRITT